jgi:hypothetical protein
MYFVSPDAVSVQPGFDRQSFSKALPIGKKSANDFFSPVLAVYNRNYGVMKCKRGKAFMCFPSHFSMVIKKEDCSNVATAAATFVPEERK